MHELKYLVTAGICSLLASAAVSAAPPTLASNVVIACYDVESGRARIVQATTDCERRERYFIWNINGPQGPAGPVGVQGPSGFPVPAGEQGPGDRRVIRALQAQRELLDLRGYWSSRSNRSSGSNWPSGSARPAKAFPVCLALRTPGAPGAAGPAGPPGTIPTNLTTLSPNLTTTNEVSLADATTFVGSACNNMNLGDVVLSVNGYGQGALPADGRLMPAAEMRERACVMLPAKSRIQ